MSPVDTEQSVEIDFMDGSRYEGNRNELGLNGPGRFVLPHGVTYRGEFRSGTFHGEGSVYWARGQRLDGIWNRGETDGREMRYRFADGLIFEAYGWNYCRPPDRRFHICAERGILGPAGDTLKTARLSGSDVPAACYDLPIGFFHPNLGCILSYRNSRGAKGKIIEIPTASKVQWIKEHCRKAWAEPAGPTGHCSCLCKNRFAPDPQNSQPQSRRSTILPFSDKSFECWWKRLVSTGIREYVPFSHQIYPLLSPLG